jgi:NAD(P)-dependent dehydrogenase (short-subunit alcohol dehydrogenase family)
LNKNAIVISASSDIGTAICQRWLIRGWRICGTYRTYTSNVRELQKRGATLIHCNVLDASSVSSACGALRKTQPNWHILILAPGTLDPIGPFINCDFENWETSVKVNFTSQLRIVHDLLCTRCRGSVNPTVLFFAGGGTNSAVINYSAYVISKIALIKMCELLDAEIKDTKFAIVGPGWVKTKIHKSTMKAGKRGGSNYDRTVAKLSVGNFTPIDRVIDCCEWIIGAPREVVSGRNFSVAYDAWDTEDLEVMLTKDNNMYKLRRMGNDISFEKEKEANQ